jgi:hypothetical protein
MDWLPPPLKTTSEHWEDIKEWYDRGIDVKHHGIVDENTLIILHCFTKSLLHLGYESGWLDSRFVSLFPSL